MNGIIKVSPEALRQTSSEFSAQGSKLNQTTNEMMNLVEGLSSSWQGEASSAYLAKFRALQDDMQLMFRMVQEHSTDLNEMAENYARAETQNTQAASALSDDVII